MPLLSIEKVRDDTRLAVWHITESAEDFYHLFPHLQEHRKSLDLQHRLEVRKLEYLSVHALLYLLTCDPSLAILHQSSGQPLLNNGKNISISHTKGFVCILLSDTHRVGVDIEYRSNRVERVSSRFLRTDEVAPTTVMKLLHWSAKEAFYKLFSEDHLSSEDIKIIPFEYMSAGTMTVAHVPRNISLGVSYRVTDEFVMTYCMF